MVDSSRSAATPPETQRLEPPAVLVTGGSGVIGRAICLEFGRAGWRVGVQYRSRLEAAEQTAAGVVRHGGTAALFQADIREAKQVRAMVEAFLQRWTRLDVLVCNAGQAGGGLVLRTSPEQWAATIEANLTGAFHCLQAVGPVLVGRKEGAVIVVSSFAGLRGRSGQAAYAAAKAGLLGLVKSTAREWGPHNVRVNAVCPGWHASDLAGGAAPDEREIGEAMGVNEHVLGRFANLESVARSVYHLARQSDASGQVWNLDSRIL